MIYLTLTVLCNVFLLVLFKVFPKYGINTLSAIIINYLTAAVTGILFIRMEINLMELAEKPWFKLAVPLGVIFIVVFFLISLTTQKIGVSTASVANKMSVVLPVMFSVIFLSQELNVFRVCGIVLALISVYLTSKKENNHQVGKHLIWLPALVFIGSGGIDVALNAANSFYITTKTDSAMFSICIFSSAFLCGTLFLMVKKLTTNAHESGNFFNLKNCLAGIILGVPNYFSIYFTLKALESGLMDSARLFPVMNMTVVVLSALIAFIIFHEKLSKFNVVGILLAVISILLIAI